MWVIFSAQNDIEAQWLQQGLQRHGISSVEWVVAESLPQVQEWDLRIGDAGSCFELKLADGRCIDSHQVDGVINRIQFLPEGHSSLAVGSDREYVQQEMMAFYLGWLNAFPGVVLNRPHPHGLDGAMRHPSNWMYLASRAGLEVPPYQLSSREPWHMSWHKGPELPLALQHAPRSMLFVIDTQVVVAQGQTAPPNDIAEAAIRLAQISNTPLLGLQFVRPAADEWLFVGADVHPPLSMGGEALLGAIVNVFAVDREEERRMAG